MKWKLISVHLEIVLISTQDKFALKVPQAWKSFWTYSMVLLGTWVKGRLVSVRFEIVLILTQDRCMICAERAIVLEVLLGAPDGTPRLHGSCGISFGPFRDGVSVTAR